MSNTHKTNDLAQRVSDWVIDKNPTNETLVQIIELLGDFAELKTISQYATDNNMSYNGVKKHRKIIELFGNKYVYD